MLNYNCNTKTNFVNRANPVKTLLIALVCSLLLLVGMPSPVSAAGEATASCSVTLIPTFECIGVYASFSGDTNENNSASLEYKLHTSSTWIQGMDMTPDRRDSVNGQPNPYNNQWRASVLGLDPDTEYDARVTFSDPDNGSDIVVTETITTRNDDPNPSYSNNNIPTTGTLFYVDTSHPSASDSNPGTEALPFKTISTAVKAVSAGDTVYVKAGTYDERQTIAIAANGTIDNYITIRNYPGDHVTIDAAGYTSGFQVLGCCIRIKGFEVIGGSKGIMVGPGNAHDVIIEDNVVKDAKTLASTPSNYYGILLDGNGDPARNNHTVQNNDIYVVEPGATGGDSSGPGIVMDSAGGGHVIRNNNIYYTGTLGVHGRDGINNTPNESFNNTVQDTDIYGNFIRGATDDGISLDGNACNVRVWENTITRTCAGISVAPVLIGPAYIFRNTLYDPEPHWQPGTLGIKGANAGTGHVYVYHNTIAYDNLNVGAKDSTYNFGMSQAGADISNIYFKNNVISSASVN